MATSSDLPYVNSKLRDPNLGSRRTNLRAHGHCEFGMLDALVQTGSGKNCSKVEVTADFEYQPS